MAQITYADKVALNTNPQIADINKVNDSDMNEIKSVVNQNDTNVGDLSSLATNDKSSLVGAINELNNKNLKKLWENSNPKNNFIAQNITLSSDDYDYLIWFYYDDTGNNYSMSRQHLKGSGTVFNHAFAGSVTNISRTIARVSDTNYNINECMSVTTSGSTTTNNRLIPAVVYGGNF